MRVLTFACLIGLSLTGASSLQEAANPIRKIITLMQDMQKEIDVEGAKEKVLYDKFMCFCNGGTQDLEKDLADAKMTFKTLTSRHEQMTSEKSSLGADITDHTKELAAAEADLASAANIRSKEKAEFDAEFATKKGSADALAKAIPEIEKGLGGASLMQSPSGNLVPALKRALASSQQISASDRQVLLSFLSQGAPGSSAEVVGMLKSMHDEFTRASDELAATEERGIKTFEGMKKTKEQDMELAKTAIENKKARSGTLAVEIVQAANGIDDANEEITKTTKFLATLSEQCLAKKKDWAYRSNMREQEKAAIGQAIAILNDDDALDVFKKAAGAALMQTGQHQTGFLQDSNDKRLDKATKIIASVKARSHKMDLLQYTLGVKLRAAHRAHGVVDFGAVVKMVDEMIVTLNKASADDAKHKDWCIIELGKSEKAMKSTQDKVTELDASSEEISDDQASFADDVATLKAAIASLDKDVAQATETRKSEHVEYQEEVQLGATAIQLIGKAKNRLQKFYNPTLYKAPPKKEISMEDKIVAAGTSALTQAETKFDDPDYDSFIQTHLKQPAAPATYGAYEKKGQKSGGVMALMDMITGELASSKQAAELEEKTAQKSYEAFMAESQATRQQQTKALTEKESSKADLESRLTDVKEAKQATLAELENAHEYAANIHQSCDFIVGNFEARIAARKQELEGLKNAKAVLSGASYA